MKDKLIFDVTDANSIADSDSIGAYLRASDGTLLTHSDVGGKKALDVSIADGVNVEVDLSHLDDSVRLGDGTSFFTSTSENGDIALDVHISNSDLDIRDLAFATDSVTAHQGGTWVIDSITNVVSIDDNGGSITVDAIQLDIDDLDAAVDSVASHLFDGAGTALTSTSVNGDQALDVNISNEISVNDAALANTAILASADTLGAANVADPVVASALADRKYLFIRNNDNRVMYIGQDGVTTSNGFPVSPGSYLEMRAGASVVVDYVSEKTGHSIRVLELS